MSIKTTTTKAAKLLAVVFGSAIVLSFVFIGIFTSDVMNAPKAQAVENHEAVSYDIEIDEFRNFTAVKHIALTRYDISGGIQYTGAGEYFINAKGWNKDHDKLLIIIGSTGDHVSTQVIKERGYDNYYADEYDRDYSDLAVKWFAGGD